MDNPRKNSLRLTGYDYGNDGSYFVTICSFGRRSIFSNIKNREVILTQTGIILNSAIKETSIIRDYVTIAEYIIMPNHVHLIIHIHKESKNPGWLPSGNIYHKLVLSDENKNMFKPQSHNLASIVRGLKSAVTTSVKKSGVIGKVWQRGYHDRIIRNQEELIKIEKYIIQNPMRWDSDEYFT